MQRTGWDRPWAAPPDRPPARTGFVVSDLMALVLLLLAVAGALLDRTLFALMGALVLGVVLVARVWTRVALEGVRYALSTTPSRVFEGDELALTLTVENRKALPVSRIKIRERLPPGLELQGGEDSAVHTFGVTVFDAVVALAPNERVRLNYRVKARRRGHYLFGPARIEAGDPFGFYTSSHDVTRFITDLVVYPKLIPALGLSPLLARPMGEVVASLRTFDDPNLPATVREYRAGDSMRTIDWKITARRGSPHVRVNDASLSGAVVILLECDTRGDDLQEESPELLERCVRVAASLASQLITRRHSVGLLANGVPPGDHPRLAVPPAAGTQQLVLILEALARVQSLIVKPLPVLAAENSARLMPFGASVICVAGIDAPHLSKMLQNLASRGHPSQRVRVVDPKVPAGEQVRITGFVGTGRERALGSGTIR